MRLKIQIIIFFLILCCNINARSSDYSPGVVILKFSTASESQIISFLNKSGAYSFDRVFPVTKSLSNIYSLKFSRDADIESLVRQFRGNPIIEYAQPDYLNRLSADSNEQLNDEFYENQWAIKAIDVPEAWETEKGSKDIVIAVVDTGVDYNHEDLKDRIWTNPGEIADNGIDDDGNGYVDDIRGWDFVDAPDMVSTKDHLDRDNDPMDEKRHGTHVAGIIGAVPNNSLGIAGILWDCRIMPLRGGSDYLEDDDVSAAIVYAADNGARIINMSWGGSTLSYVILDAVDYAYDRGCILVGAAGNDDSPAVIYPALHNHVISVGATDKEDKKASFSNYGPGIDIVAPGDRVYGTTPENRYSPWSGTSMAAPVVSGVAALMLSKRPSLTNQEVYQILKQTADKIDEPLFDDAGRVNAAKALVASVPLVARILQPENGGGVDKNIDISGSGAGLKFRKFLLEYAAPGDEDWRLINTQNVPVLDNLLGSWDTKNLDEGFYIIRLRVLGDDFLEAEDKIILNVDHSPPEINRISTVSRIQAGKYRYAVTWQSDDLTFGEMYYRAWNTKGDFQRFTTASISRGHNIYVSDYLSPGKYEYFIKGTNRSGLASVDDNNGNNYFMEIKSLRVPSDGFIENTPGIPALHPLGEYDFDDDGIMEIVGMETKWEYDTVKMYEKDISGAYNEVFSSDKDYIPWGIDDTDGDGLYEILGSVPGATFLYESPSPGEYPTDRIWEVEGLGGGRIADMDQDGHKEILARHLESNSINIYENREDNSYLRAARLENPTDGLNNLATTFAISDFDGDGRKEIVIGDQDGDIFIYENIDNDSYEHTWTGKLPDSQIIFVNSGDYNGDGKEEFIIGARVPENRDSLKMQWVFAIFHYVGDNDYGIAWSQEINGMENSEGGITIGDLDNDGMDEICLLVTPGFYIFKYSPSGDYEPIWYHPAGNTRWPVIMDFDSDGVNDILFNEDDSLKVFRFKSRAQRPWGLTATPLGENEIELRWNGPLAINTYKIYSGINKNNLNLIKTLNLSGTPGYFRDGNLISEVTYWYSVASVNGAGKEEMSDKVSVTPNSPPKLLNAQYAPPYTIRLIFSEAMGPSAQNESSYIITTESGFEKIPSSALLDFHNERVVLNLTEALQEGSYKVTAHDIRDASGVPISAGANTVNFQVIVPTTGELPDLSQMIVYPNPIMPDSRHPGRITFDKLPPSTKIRIYNWEGQLVRILDEQDKDKMIWYLDNDQHQEVASGLYIYFAESNTDRKSGKIAMIR